MRVFMYKKMHDIMHDCDKNAFVYWVWMQLSCERIIATTL